MLTEPVANDENLSRDWFEYIVEEILSTVIAPENKYESYPQIDIPANINTDAYFLYPIRWERKVYKLTISPQDYEKYLSLTLDGKKAIGFRVTGLFRLLKNRFSVISLGNFDGVPVAIEAEYKDSLKDGYLNTLDSRFKSIDLPVENAYKYCQFDGFGDTSPESKIEINVTSFDYEDILETIGYMGCHNETKFLAIQRRLVEDIFLLKRIDLKTDILIDRIALLCEFKPQIEVEESQTDKEALDYYLTLKISAPLTWFKMYLPFYEHWVTNQS